MTKRQRLKLFLLQEIELLKEEDWDDEELLATLYAAVRGLENLERGQIDDIFALGRTGLHGSQPATVKRCEAHAVGTVFALKKRGMKVADAEQAVATAYIIEPDALRQWKKKLKKTKDEVLLEIVDSYKKPTVIFVTDIPRILAEVERKGDLYRKAKAPAPKTGKKTK